MDSPPLSYTGMSDGCCTPGGGCSSLSGVANHDTVSDLEAFSNLSLEERESVLEELHGVAGDTEETPELIQSCLSQMRREISRFHGRKRKYWDRACFLCPTLEKNDNILLLFLRGERYNPRLAAEKLTLHYEHKAELFPVEMLPRRITLDDLDEDDMQCMRNGALQMLQQKDQTGRTVVVCNISKVKRKHWKNELRYDFYQAMAMLSEESAQKKGLVFVVLIIGDLASMSQAFEGVRHGGHILAGFAIRRVGMHCCYDDPMLRPLFATLRRGVPREAEVRQRFHYGSRLECDYALRSFGICVDPTLWYESPSRVDTIEKYIQGRKEVEAELKRQDEIESNGRIMYPNHMDVLVGRGRPYQEFPGNVRLAALVAASSQSYSRSVDRMEKTVLSMHVVQKMKDSGSRFLRRTEDCWEIVDDSIAREKVVHALRILARKQRLP